MASLTRPRPIATLCGALVWCVSAAATLAGPPDPSTFPAIADKHAAAALARPGAAGLSICIALDDHIVLTKGYGLADVATGRPVTEDTVFHACSVSKQFLAAAIMRLAEQGKVALDAPISEYLPEFPTPGRTITLRQLLCHTSGLKGYTEIEAFNKQEDRDLTHGEILALIKAEPPLFAPGERFAYCNTGSYLLGMVVESESGLDYSAFFEREFAAPLNLAHTGYRPHAADAAQWAQGHELADGHAVPAHQISWTNAFAGGGITSTPRELVQWQIALHSGHVLSPPSYTQLTTPQELSDGSPIAYGLYWYVREHRGHPVVFHTGTGPGCSAWLAYYPEDHLTISVMSNSGVIWAPKFGIGLAMAILGADGPPRDAPMSAALISRCTGEFQEQSGDGPGRFRVYERDGSLWSQAEGMPDSRLLYQGGSVFVVDADHDITLTFPQVFAMEPAEAPAAERMPAPFCDTDNQVMVRRAVRVK